ncbi:MULTISPECIES: hypothetical protein [unclassified Streptomyces]|uniref:hypothetical protein n=1 Tax=unclassified Streptomyces TaxID=2593676 RepID=UPI002DDA0E89|nr:MULTISPECIES: hypothetical protein [unclassified Streptomyces]WSF81769.1 hypothetical protein OIE70_00250 [Streptomyces sp. NBC_01744]WSC34136.1 hypothetical protein OHA08_00240 [Streptomyces sp. NBC_01763]WSC41922.1 hypothetical protein OHA08_44740 [Streptomyces sp. NBC_01763]WSC50934.1 hypothetical protein OG808_00240 [Streptomyces sp. NBC_01761]WSC58587.1 hypothetical protein OG808_44075 [Streptomyces sp. NBC_01761]
MRETRFSEASHGLDEDDDTDQIVRSLLDREERRLLAAAPEPAEGADTWLGLVAEPGFVRRASVLARAAPLHRIDQRQAWQQFPADLYDPRTLALAALEAVVSRQGMEVEATTEDVVAFLASLARAAAPGREEAEHLAVARFVLRELLNDAQGGEEFDISYSDYRAGHQRVTVSLRFLEEGFGRHGQAVLKATAPAINLLLAGLEYDVEDEQAAKDAMLRRQVSTGRWGRAEDSAADSLKLSLLYGERVRAVLEETGRDVRAVDWKDQVPQLLRSARSHLGERQKVERELMEWTRQARREVKDADVQLTCARVLRLLERAHLRHTQLLASVIDARPMFLRSQAEQRFRPVPRLSLVGVQEDLLEPVLELGLDEAELVASLFADGVAGPVVRHRPRLRDWWELLLAPVREARDAFPDEEVELVAEEADESGLYSEADVAVVRGLLEGALGAPVRLSALLEQALECGVEAADLLAVSVLQAYAPDPEEEEETTVIELEDLLGERLVVLDDGTDFDLGVLGGSDLLLVPVQPLIPDPSSGDRDRQEAAA